MATGGPELHASRAFRAGPLTFAVDSAQKDVLVLIEQLFRDLPGARPTDGAAHRFILSRSAGSVGDESFDLSGPVVGSRSGLSLAHALMWLVSSVSRANLDLEPERLHLHAAAAVRDGEAIILAAPRETGKTTTVARLGLAGWAYMSDETISVAPCDDRVRGFPKPLSVKPGSRQLLRDLAPHMVPGTDVGDREVLHVAAGAHGIAVSQEAVPRLVALLSRPADATVRATSTPLHPVDAVVALMGDTMDAARFGPGAVLELARLAARCRCHRVIVADPDSTTAELEHLFAEPPDIDLVVDALHSGTWINPAVATVLIGDRVVIHEQPEGRILALDAVGSGIWLQLGGWRSGAEVDLSAPVTAQFVATLVGMGLVDGQVVA